MEKFTQFRDRGSGIAPFLPIPGRPFFNLWLPGNLLLFFLRLPVIVFLLGFYLLVLQWVPIGSWAKKPVLGLIMIMSTIWWSDINVDGVKKGKLANDRLAGPGEVVVCTFTSPMDALTLEFIYNPIFTASYPNTRKVEQISLLQAILRAFASPQTTPPANAQLVEISLLQRTYPERTIVTFPECTTTNGRGILPLSPCLLSAKRDTRIFPVILTYTPADIVTPVPGSYFAFVWALMSTFKHSLRIRVAAPVVGTSETNGASTSSRKNTYETNILDILDSDEAEGSTTREGRTITPGEKAFLNRISESLVRLGRAKRVGLGVQDKVEFARLWAKRQRR